MDFTYPVNEYRPGALLVLVSFAAHEVDQNDFGSPALDSSFTPHPKRIYCIIPIVHDLTTGSFSIDKQERMVKVPYQSVRSPSTDYS